jgi:hypothetical protein
MKPMTPEQKAAVRDRLQELENANDGVLLVDAIVADAKSKSSPLHSHFEWDTKKAAQEHWRNQARELIRSVMVTVNTMTSNVTSVAYVRDPRQASDKQGYVSVTAVRDDAELARDILVVEFSRVASMLRRAREIATVLGAQDDIETLIQQVVGLRQRFESDPPAATQ